MSSAVKKKKKKELNDLFDNLFDGKALSSCNAEKEHFSVIPLNFCHLSYWLTIVCKLLDMF